MWGLTINEFVVYVKAQKELLQLESKETIAKSHTAATLNALAVSGKLKSVESYLPHERKVDNSYSLEKSREISRMIDKLKRGGDPE